jgi:hypothetical protein
MKVVGVVLSLTLLLAACADAGPTPATQLASDPSTALLPASAGATTTPSPIAQSTMRGDFPGPSATVPPGARVLANVQLQELADLWASLGLSCQSHASGGPESPAGYAVHCDGGDAAGDIAVVAEADYWTPGGVVDISVSVGPSRSGSIDATATASEWVFPFARLAGGDAAVAWVQGHIEDPSCLQGCTEAVRGSQLSYYSGSRGAQELFYEASVPTPS